LSFSVIQEFETLMQESKKKLIDIHKWRVFFIRVCRSGHYRPAGSLS